MWGALGALCGCPGGGAGTTAKDGHSLSEVLRADSLDGDEGGDTLDALSTKDGVQGPPLPTLEIVREAGLGPQHVGVLVNLADPQSVAVAEAYVARRNIPSENVIELSFESGVPTLTPEAFSELKEASDAAASDQVQVWALTWTFPYRVGCMGVTSAFALGYDDIWCHSGPTCDITAASGFYDATTRRPWTDLGIRPAMMLAGQSTEAAIALIDRGVAADGTRPGGTGYLIKTSDSDRNVRYPQMAEAALEWSFDDTVGLQYLQPEGDIIQNVSDTLFYFTGLIQVGGLETLEFFPGAIADHVTSFGGVLDGTSQMTVLAWLSAGATGSYGTVREPCNLLQKFPDVLRVLRHYVHGETLIEAYWKSVAWPGEGLFVGEPLASPWGGDVVELDEQSLSVQTTALWPGMPWVLEASDVPDDSNGWTEVATGQAPFHHGTTTIAYAPLRHAAYRLRYGSRRD